MSADDRFVLTETTYGGHGVFDRESDLVAPMIGKQEAVHALAKCVNGDGGIYVWRPTYEEERR